MYKLPVGIDSFREIAEQGYYFVDKTMFIRQIVDAGAKVTLITRPRRFGKTLLMSMLREFFDIKSAAWDIFAGLNISLDGEEYMGLRGRYPVVFLSMKGAALGGLENTVGMLRWALSELYEEFSYLLYSEALSEDDRRYFQRILSRDNAMPTQDIAKALHKICVCLYRHHGVKPIVLIDEYDAPIQYAWENGFYDEMIGFMRQFYSEALKSNEVLEFAVLTGVLRVAKESIFSGLNNLRVCTVLSEAYNDIFGFTAKEVAKMARDLGHEDKLGELREWYDGYNFGGAEIYNPWSVVQYFMEGCKAAPYWVNTSANGIIRQVMKSMNKKAERELQLLMQGKTIFKVVNESIIYDEIGSNTDDFYTMLLTTGYLKSVGVSADAFGEKAELTIPNKEIYNLFRIEIFRYMTGYRGISDVRDMLNSMLAGEADEFEVNLGIILRNYVSCHDAANGESFYHGMMLGFCVLLRKTHMVESNRESGYGRFDLALLPVNVKYYGVILEFKRAASEKDLEAEALAALAQIEDLSYLSEFEKRRVHNVWKYGIAFYGKKVCLRRGI